ncbi:transketolase [Desulfocurvibacter africanus]|uniref:transketolase n=1 Tax=Desulfocurvibacter africanus TaxID=873 RepID=UPI002FDA8962
MNDNSGISHLAALSLRVRHAILACSTRAGSGHPTSSLSAVELMTALMFGGFFNYDPLRPDYAGNDRLIFSKGHASPLFYSLWHVAGQIDEAELMTFREFGSRLEGHPTPALPFTEAATGSLGQGLSIGLGMALNARRLDKLPCRSFVLLGDSEMAEGSVWEAMEIAAHYKLDNLVGILDVNRLGQRGETLHGHDIAAWARKAEAFGWRAIPVEDGHDLRQVLAAYEQALNPGVSGAASGKPVMIVARTIKGKGVAAIEDKPDWHGKPLPTEAYKMALELLGEADPHVRGELAPPPQIQIARSEPTPVPDIAYAPDKPVATRKAYGQALARLAPAFPDMVALDGEVSNSTYAELFAKAHPERFFEMYVAEQNMVGAAVGLAGRGKIPFVSSFAAFLTRAADQIRMARYSEANLKLCGSHAGISIGQDGASQMGLEDLALFRAVLDCVVLYPADAVSCERLVEAMARHEGMAYLRTTRMATPILYGPGEDFPLGGCKILRRNDKDVCTIVAAGITLHEALAAADMLAAESIPVRVIDLYSIKPVDAVTLQVAARETGALVTVEDHYPEGGLGEAVLAALADTPVPVRMLAVRKLPRSGRPAELLDYAHISRKHIASNVKDMLS